MSWRNVVLWLVTCLFSSFSSVLANKLSLDFPDGEGGSLRDSLRALAKEELEDGYGPRGTDEARHALRSFSDDLDDEDEAANEQVHPALIPDEDALQAPALSFDSSDDMVGLTRVSVDSDAAAKAKLEEQKKALQELQRVNDVKMEARLSGFQERLIEEEGSKAELEGELEEAKANEKKLRSTLEAERKVAAEKESFLAKEVEEAQELQALSTGFKVSVVGTSEKVISTEVKELAPRVFIQTAESDLAEEEDDDVPTTLQEKLQADERKLKALKALNSKLELEAKKKDELLSKEEKMLQEPLYKKVESLGGTSEFPLDERIAEDAAAHAEAKYQAFSTTFGVLKEKESEQEAEVASGKAEEKRLHEALNRLEKDATKHVKTAKSLLSIQMRNQETSASLSSTKQQLKELQENLRVANEARAKAEQEKADMTTRLGKAEQENQVSQRRLTALQDYSKRLVQEKAWKDLAKEASEFAAQRQESDARTVLRR